MTLGVTIFFMKKKIRVALGLSGGVDSAVSAYLLKKQGFDVSCIYLNCFDSDIPGCRGDNDRKDALAVAMHLGLPFQVLDFRKEYQAAVIDYFKKEYLTGRTPNPDVICNRDIKFGLFLDWTIKEGFDYVATGHYARVSDANPRIHANATNGRNSHHSYEKFASFVSLFRPSDEHKDQTYFLWAVPKEKFKRVLFPLGNLLKTEVREIALKIGLPVAKKKDSTGICFVGEVRVEDFLKRLGVKEKEGEVVDASGRAIGVHNGVPFYTIGQRHGFEVNSKFSNKTPLYVIEKDIKKNSLIVGFGAECYKSEFEVEECNWFLRPSSFGLRPLLVRIRHGGELIPCMLETKVKSKQETVNSKQAIVKSKQSIVNSKLLPITDYDLLFTVRLRQPQRGIAPGQSAVFYSKNGIVLGGGIIQ